MSWENSDALWTAANAWDCAVMASNLMPYCSDRTAYTCDSSNFEAYDQLHSSRQAFDWGWMVAWEYDEPAGSRAGQRTNESVCCYCSQSLVELMATRIEVDTLHYKESDVYCSHNEQKMVNFLFYFVIFY